MKKVLLATTALALSAGVASAEITLSGSARMGLVYTDSTASVQRVHTAATVAAGSLNVNRVGTAVTASDLAVIRSGAASALNSFTSANGAALATASGNVTSAQASLALATAAQDATAIAAANTALATANANLATATAAAAASVTGLALSAADAAVAAATGVAGTDSSTVFDNRIQINIDASAETSSGLTFGVRTRVRINEDETGALNAPRVYVKSGAVEVAMGNIYGALDSMTGMYDSEVGLTALNDAGVVLNTVGKGDWNFDNYSSQGTGANGVEVIYSAGAFTGHLSYSDSDLGSNADRVAAYGAYTMNDWTVALGMQDSDLNAEDKTVLTVGGKVGDYGVGFAAADNDGVSKIALNGSATFGATTVNGFVADDESGTDTAYGLGVSYVLIFTQK